MWRRPAAIALSQIVRRHHEQRTNTYDQEHRDGHQLLQVTGAALPLKHVGGAVLRDVDGARDDGARHRARGRFLRHAYLVFREGRGLWLHRR